MSVTILSKRLFKIDQKENLIPLFKALQDLAKKRWKGRTAIAKPLFGTTASHVACLFAALGKEKATNLLDDFKATTSRFRGGTRAARSPWRTETRLLP